MLSRSAFAAATLTQEGRRIYLDLNENIAAASAALADRNHVQHVRQVVTTERSKWNAVLEDLHLTHTRPKILLYEVGLSGASMRA